MTDVLVFPDVEALAVAAVNERIDDFEPLIRASTKVPNPRPTEFIRIMRAGGTRETLVSENGFLIVEGWAQKESRALRLLNVARGILGAQDGGPLFGYSEIGGVSNLPDPTTSQIRYTMTVGLRVRASAL